MNLSILVATLVVLHLANPRRIASHVVQSLPSTLAHELSHYLVAAVLGCKPTGFSLIPKRMSKTSWQLGSVSFTPGLFSAGLVALAPLWLQGLISYWILWLRPPSSDIGIELLSGIVGGISVWAAIPSKVDWNIAIRNPAGTLLLAYAMASFLASSG